MDKKPTISLSFNDTWINLSADALAFLAESTGGTSNFRLFYRLLIMMQLKEAVVQIRGLSVSLMPGQVNAPMNSLQKDWGVSRKCISSFFDKLEKLGVISKTSDRITTVIDMRCVFAWHDDSGRVKNALFHQVKGQTVETTTEEPMQA